MSGTYRHLLRELRYGRVFPTRCPVLTYVLSYQDHRAPDRRQLQAAGMHPPPFAPSRLPKPRGLTREHGPGQREQGVRIQGYGVLPAGTRLADLSWRCTEEPARAWYCALVLRLGTVLRACTESREWYRAFVLRVGNGRVGCTRGGRGSRRSKREACPSSLRASGSAPLSATPYLLRHVRYLLCHFHYLLRRARYLLRHVCRLLRHFRYLLRCFRYAVSAICYAVSATCLRRHYAMCGTDVRHVVLAADALGA
eukprot:1121999-Rhodomonas_salina.1